MTIQIGDANANPAFTDVVQQTQSLGALNAQNQVQLRGQANATVQVTGIGSLTLVFEVTTDGSNFDGVTAYPIAGGAGITSTTANGHWSVPVTGFFQFRVRVSAFTSGTATVSVIASQGTAIPPVSAAGNSREDLIAWAGTALGTPTNFGTTPTAVIAGSVNSSLFAGTVSVPSGTLGTSPGAVAGTIPTNSTLILGTTVARTNQATTATGTLDVNVVGLIGTTAVQAAAGIPKTGISGATAATLDSVTTAASTPANALAVSVANVTTAPSLATGQSVALQGDYQGSVFVKPYRRGQTKGQATSITTTGAQTIITAQGAGIFADISTLVITITPQPTTASSFTATLSDGTASYIFDLVAEITTAAGTNPLVIPFDPPLAATSAATAWTINISATNTIHVTANFVLQKAS